MSEQDFSSSHKAINQRDPDTGFWHAFAAVFLLSASFLVIEISFSHLFSVTLQHSMIFAVVGASLLGMGLGGFLFYLSTFKFTGFTLKNNFLIVLGLCFPAAVILALYIVTHLSTAWYAAVPIILGPFIIGGALLAALYKRYAARSHTIYYGELSGAAIGCLLAILLMNLFDGPVNTIVFVAGVALAVPFIFVLATKKKIIIAIFGILLVTGVVCGLYNTSTRFIGLDYAKVGRDEFTRNYLGGENIVDSRWDAYSRVDMTPDRDEGDFTRLLHINSGTQATMLNLDTDDLVNKTKLRRLTGFLNFFPFSTGKNDQVLIVGAGGGMEVAMALMSGAKHVSAVEINPTVVQMTLDYSAYNGGIYRFKNVEVTVAEGRSFIKGSEKDFDLIFLPLAYSRAAVKSGRLVFAEEYLHTVEGLGDSFKRLASGGRVAVVVNDARLLAKLFETTRRVLLEQGYTGEQARKSVVMLEDKGGTSYSHLLMIKKGGFFREEVDEIKGLAIVRGFEVLYLPGSGRVNLFIESAQGVSPATDDSPFFLKLEDGLPAGLGALIAVAALFMLVFVVVFAVCNRVRDSIRLHSFLPLYFMAIGMGYMLAEISLIQRFVLFLGYPTLGLSVVLFGFLLSSAVGSFLSQYVFVRGGGKALKRPLVAGAALFVLLVLYYLFLPGILDSLLSLTIAMKSLVCFALILPLGLLVGVPFPTGIVIAREYDPGAVPWVFGLNGVSCFMGALLVMAIAFKWGWGVSLLVAAVLYGLVSVLSYVYGRTSA